MFALPVEQALQGSGGQEKRHGQLLSHNCCTHIDILDAGKDIGHQIAALIGFGIPPPRHFVVCRAVNIVKYRKRQAFPGERAEVVHIVAIRNIHNGLSIRRSCASARRSICVGLAGSLVEAGIIAINLCCDWRGRIDDDSC